MTAGGPLMGENKKETEEKKEKTIKRTLTAIDIFEMTETGLKLIVRMEAEETSNDEEIQESISSLVNAAYNNNKMYIVTETQGFSIGGLENKTIVVKGVFLND